MDKNLDFSYRGYKAQIIIDETKETDDPLIEKQFIAVLKHCLRKTVDELAYGEKHDMDKR